MSIDHEGFEALTGRGATWDAEEKRIASERQALRMSPWRAEPNAHWQRRLGKTNEELAELLGVAARIQIQGYDGVDPATGKTNRQRFHEESADVLAQLRCNRRAFGMDWAAVEVRAAEKERQMAEWEALVSGPMLDVTTLSDPAPVAIRADEFPIPEQYVRDDSGPAAP